MTETTVILGRPKRLSAAFFNHAFNVLQLVRQLGNWVKIGNTYRLELISRSSATESHSHFSHGLAISTGPHWYFALMTIASMAFGTYIIAPNLLFGALPVPIYHKVGIVFILLNFWTFGLLTMIIDPGTILPSPSFSQAVVRKTNSDSSDLGSTDTFPGDLEIGDIESMETSPDYQLRLGADFADARTVVQSRKDGGKPCFRTHCRFCGALRTPTSDHCHDCNICVEDFDHHCPWTSKCIGGRNRLVFYLWLMFLVLSFGYSGGVFAVYSNPRYVKPALPAPSELAFVEAVQRRRARRAG